MASVLGAITTSHVPAIGGAIANGLQQDPYFKPFFDPSTAMPTRAGAFRRCARSRAIPSSPGT
jgi:hypothetical protein